MSSKKAILNRPLIELRNIGKKIAGRLNEIDVYTEEDLKQMGAAAAHKCIKKNYPNETLAVCYYLYSFEGAVTGTHWNDIPEKRKQALRQLITEGKQN